MHGGTRIAFAILSVVIEVSSKITLSDDEIEESFIRSSGPGGQHVNTSATGVQLRFDAAGSPSLADDVRARLLKLAGAKATEEGVVVISASRFRSQKANREDALSRLIELIRKAETKPKRRTKTKPTKASKERRVKKKKRRGEIKESRKPIRPPD